MVPTLTTWLRHVVNVVNVVTHVVNVVPTLTTWLRHVVDVVTHVVNVVICIQRGIMHRPTRLRRVGPRLARLRRAKRGVFCLPRYYALFPTPY